MARSFPLAGLLRLRHLQQDQAAGDLAATNASLRESGMRQDRVRTALGATSTDLTSTSSLHAIAAARASTRSMLADLEALRHEQQAAADDAAARFTTARSQSVGLEKLQGRYAAAVDAEELHAEQTVLDEIASGSWQRREASR